MRSHKIVSFSVVILLITVVFAGAVTVPAAGQYDTMQYRYNAAHTGDYSPVAGSVPSNGQLKWNYTTEGSAGSSPAVANGLVFVVSSDNMLNDVDNNLYALNVTTGTEVWSLPTGDPVSNPAIANGLVYVGSEDGNVYAFNATTGAYVWNYATVLSPYSPWGGIDSPAVYNGLVFVGNYSQYNGGNFYALNATTGTEVWSFPNGGDMSSPAVANGTVYVGSDDSNLYALNATTGTEVWSFPTGFWVVSSPAVYNGVVYVGSYDNNFYAINATSGAKLWNYTTGSGGTSSPAVYNGVVYVGLGSNLNDLNNNLYALNATTGAKLWNYTTGESISDPAVANGVVYVGSDDNNIYALNATTGAKLWNYTTGGYVGDPAIANGVVYVGSGDNNVYAIGTQLEPSALTLTASNITPAVNQKVTFNATLTSSGTPISGENVSIYHLLNGVRYNDTTNVTNPSGQVTVTTSFGSPGTRTYYASFAGDSSYQNSTSKVVTVNVNAAQTSTTLAASTTTPAVNQEVTFTATLKSGGAPISEPVTIYHYLNGVRHNDVNATTNATGQLTLSTSFGSFGKYTYYATFAGNSAYKASTSSVVTVNVGQTQLSLSVTNSIPAVNQKVTFTATLTSAGTPISEPITVWHYIGTSGTKYTDANGYSTLTFATKWTTAGVRTYYATFAGNSKYSASTSKVLTITVR
ncbi:MAG: PQQ-binding-like beta-propeller repeat protein [Halobacteriota archaeon]|jgi:outer membrane protein assembly factor BamB